jgi:hypothetical protein
MVGASRLEVRGECAGDGEFGVKARKARFTPALQ